jgi:hypothetical protein
MAVRDTSSERRRRRKSTMPIERCTTIRPETHRTAIEIVTATWSIFQVILSMAYQEEPRVEEAPVMTTALDWVRFTAIRRSDTKLWTPWLFHDTPLAS